MIKNFIVFILLGIVAILLFTKPEYKGDTIKIVTDTVYQQKTFVKYKKGDKIPFKVLDTIYQIDAIHDTVTIISDFMRVYSYSDTIHLDSNTVFIQDTISQNKILGRSVGLNFKEKTIYITKTIQPKDKNALYLGFLGDLRQDKTLEGLGVGLMYKVKNKALIGVSIKSAQSLNYGFGIYLKL